MESIHESDALHDTLTRASETLSRARCTVRRCARCRLGGGDAPDLSFVPPLARRRLTALERVAVAALWRVSPRGAQIPVVFASRWGEIGTTLDLMRQFSAEGEMSPAKFSVSVHNAAPGAFSVLSGNRAPYTSVAAGARTFEAGVLEAVSTPGTKVLVYAEEAVPELYRPHFPEVRAATEAVAFLLEGTGERR